LGKVIEIGSNAIGVMDGYTTAHDNSVELDKQFEFDEDLLSLGSCHTLVLETIDTVFPEVDFQGTGLQKEKTSQPDAVANDYPKNDRNTEL
jgi:hypothetical protein